MTINAIHDILRASLEEQIPIRLYIHSHRFVGIVTRLDDATLELQSDGGRTAVYLCSIDAVTLEPHLESAPRRRREDPMLRPLLD